jgi:hypothetical protein
MCTDQVVPEHGDERRIFGSTGEKRHEKLPYDLQSVPYITLLG